MQALADVAVTSESDYLAQIQALLPTPCPSPVHRIPLSPSAKALWSTLPTVTKKQRRSLFRGLFLRVDLSKIDRSPLRRSHFVSDPRDLRWARSEIHSYIEQGILAPAHFDDPLVHPWFVVRRRGKRRLVVDFDRLNAAIIDPSHVSYEDLSTVPSLLRGRRWMVSVDLKSAFHHVPLSKSLQRLSCILFEGQLYHFRVMTFGLSLAPRIWCGILGSVLDHLRAQGLHLRFYMDDIILAAPSKKLARSHTIMLISFLSALGLVINPEKCVLSPTKRLLHLGFIIDSANSTFAVPREKALDIAAFCRTAALRPRLRILTAMSLLGKLMALRIAFTPTRRYTWSLIHELTQAIPPHRRLRAQLRHHRIILSSAAREDLSWIARNLLSFPPASFARRPSLHLYTDASTLGWGAYSPQLPFGCQGRWLQQSPLPHIQILELSAVLHAVDALPIPRGSRIVLHTDNTSVLSYLTHWGGSRCPELHRLSHCLWDKLLARNITLLSTLYIPSRLNTYADRLSRTF
jgi:hypothetical protein